MTSANLALPGLFLDLNPAEIVGLNDGDAVATVPDDSGKGFDATASGTVTYKTNIVGSSPVVRFDGSSGTLATASIDASTKEAITTYAVVVLRALPSAMGVLWEYGPNAQSNDGTGGAYVDVNLSYNESWSFTAISHSNSSSYSRKESWVPPAIDVPFLVTTRNLQVLRRGLAHLFVNGSPLGDYTVDTLNPNTSTARNTANAALHIASRNGAGSYLRFDLVRLLSFWQAQEPDRRLAIEAELASLYGLDIDATGVCAAWDGHSYCEGDGAVTDPTRRWWNRAETQIVEDIDAVMCARSGTTVEKFLDDRLPGIRWVDNNIAKRIWTIECGTNDLQFSYPVATVEMHLQRAWQAMHESGAQYLLFRTARDRQNVDRPAGWRDDADALNLWTASNTPAYMDTHDVGADPFFGPEGAANDAVWFDGDLVHPTEHPGETRLGVQVRDWLVSSVGLTHWTPALLSNVVLWVEADQGLAGITDGDPIATWADLSGLGHDLTAAGALRPLWDEDGGIYGTGPGVVFDGTKGMATASINLTGTNKLTVFCVFAADDLATDQTIWELTADSSAVQTGARLFRRASDDKAVVSHVGNVGTTSNTSSAVAKTDGGLPSISSAVFDKSATTGEVTQRHNGIVATSSGSNNTSGAYANAPFYLGSRGGDGATLALTGTIHALLVVAGKLDISDFRRADAYLANKWAAY